jgi:hypothetical protein
MRLFSCADFRALCKYFRAIKQVSCCYPKKEKQRPGKDALTSWKCKLLKAFNFTAMKKKSVTDYNAGKHDKA